MAKQKTFFYLMMSTVWGMGTYLWLQLSEMYVISNVRLFKVFHGVGIVCLIISVVQLYNLIRHCFYWWEGMKLGFYR